MRIETISKNFSILTIQDSKWLGFDFYVILLIYRWMGEELNSSYITERGLVGDRTYAVVDKQTGKVDSAKNPKNGASYLTLGLYLWIRHAM